MSSFNKKLTALLSAAVVLLIFIVALSVNILGRKVNVGQTSVKYVPLETTASVTTTSNTNKIYFDNSIKFDGQPNTSANSDKKVDSTFATNQNAVADADEKALSESEMLAMLTSAVNKTKAYTGNVSVYHRESFNANVTECTGGSIVASIANKLVGMVLDPTEETLNYSGGHAVNSDGETVPILLPKRGNFTLSMSGVSSISSSKDGQNTVINVTLVPESVGMHEVPAANASAIGYLDVGELDLSVLEVTAASIQYTGSSIKAVINPNGYISYAEYVIPLHVEGSAKSGVISGNAVFDGKETEVWQLNY